MLVLENKFPEIIHNTLGLYLLTTVFGMFVLSTSRKYKIFHVSRRQRSFELALTLVTIGHKTFTACRISYLSYLSH